MAAIAGLGLGATAWAQNPDFAPTNPADLGRPAGLLGSSYTQIEYNYIDLDGWGPNHADGFGVTLNQPFMPNVDYHLSYDYASAKFMGTRLRVHDAEFGMTLHTQQAWGKPFVMAGAGWQWQKGGGSSDDSFAFRVGTGVEFQVAPAITVTPFANFVRATSFGANEYELGAKATYRFNEKWSATARAQYEAVDNAPDSQEFSLGVNYHF
jgi:hypothetical protein